MSLPYPTKTRLALADAIVARHIRHYHFIVPSTLDTVRNREVTARVKEFVVAGLAEYGTPDGADVVRNWSTVALTPEGMAWVTRARTSGLLGEEITARLTAAGLEHFRISTEGPGSTSPGPGRCPTCDSRQPSMHPAAGCGGEVTRLCPDAFHAESTRDGSE